MTFLPVKKTAADMSQEMSKMVSEVNRMLDAWYEQPSRTLYRDGLWHPTMDIYDCKENLVVVLELPGVDPKNIDISIEEDHLFIEGYRKASPEYKQEEYYYSERAFGGFHRVVHLHKSVDPDAVMAKYKDGLLEVILPKRKRNRGKKVKLSK